MRLEGESLEFTETSMEQRVPSTVVIVCGLPGSGKTTHAQALAADMGAVRFSADEWMGALLMNLWDEEGRCGFRKF